MRPQKVNDLMLNYRAGPGKFRPKKSKWKIPLIEIEAAIKDFERKERKRQQRRKQ